MVKFNKRAAQLVGLDALASFADRCDVVPPIHLWTNMRREDGLPLLGRSSATGRRPLVEEYLEVCKVPPVPR